MFVFNTLNDYKKAVLMVILSGVFLSTLGIGTRLLESTSGLQLVFYRSMGLLAIIMPVIIARQSTNLVSSFFAMGKIGVMAAICLVGTSIFVVLAITNTSVANAMFIISLAPLLAGGFAWLIIGEKMSSTTIKAIALALIGVLIIIQGALSTDGLSGIIYAFCMLTCYGLFSVTLRIGKDLDMLPCVALHAIILIVVLALYLPSLTISTSDLLICLVLGIFQIGLGLILLTLGSIQVPAAQLTLLAMLEVVLSPIWVWLGVGEAPTESALLGGAIIICAIIYQALTPSTNT